MPIISTMPWQMLIRVCLLASLSTASKIPFDVLFLMWNVWCPGEVLKYLQSEELLMIATGESLMQIGLCVVLFPEVHYKYFCFAGRLDCCYKTMLPCRRSLYVYSSLSLINPIMVLSSGNLMMVLYCVEMQ